jgi:hypothetical protein
MYSFPNKPSSNLLSNQVSINNLRKEKKKKVEEDYGGKLKYLPPLLLEQQTLFKEK